MYATNVFSVQFSVPFPSFSRWFKRLSVSSAAFRRARHGARALSNAAFLIVAFQTGRSTLQGAVCGVHHIASRFYSLRSKRYVKKSLAQSLNSCLWLSVYLTIIYNPPYNQHQVDISLPRVRGAGHDRQERDRAVCLMEPHVKTSFNSTHCGWPWAHGSFEPLLGPCSASWLT